MGLIIFNRIYSLVPYASNLITQNIQLISVSQIDHLLIPKRTVTIFLCLYNLCLWINKVTCRPHAASVTHRWESHDRVVSFMSKRLLTAVTGMVSPAVTQKLASLPLLQQTPASLRNLNTLPSFGQTTSHCSQGSWFVVSFWWIACSLVPGRRQ